MNVPLNIDWQQILLHALNLVILIAGLYLLLFKPVKRFMDERTQKYQSMADDAAEKTRQAQALYADYQNRLKGADAEISKSTPRACRRLRPTPAKCWKTPAPRPSACWCRPRKTRATSATAFWKAPATKSRRCP